MTRENKLALVVGFALILFVGILVSDHFSTARQQESADLVPVVDPLVQSRRDNPDLLRFDRGQVIQASRGGGPTVRMPDLQPDLPGHLPGSGAQVALTQAQADDLPYVYHEVRPGESLTTICRQHYGDGSLVRDLATYNDLQDPDLVRTGDRLRIPDATRLVRGPSAPRRASALPRPTAAPAPAAVARETYTVKPGDVLTVIAQKIMGSARHWQALYDHNRDVIDDPDRILAGTVLRIPE